MDINETPGAQPQQATSEALAKAKTEAQAKGAVANAILDLASVKQSLAALSQGQTMADLVGITPEKSESLYALAYNLYQADNYQDAAAIFALLCLLDNLQERYYLGHAACKLGLKDYEQAQRLYEMAFAISGGQDPEPLYHAAVCMLKLKRRDDAILTLRSIPDLVAATRASDTPSATPSATPNATSGAEAVAPQQENRALYLKKSADLLKVLEMVQSKTAATPMP